MRRPRVGLNAHLLSLAASYRGAGLSRYIAGLIAHLPQVDASLDYVALVGDKRVFAVGWERRVSPWRTSEPVSRILWEQSLQTWTARRAGLDLLHVPVYVGPALAPCPLVVTVHDLSFYLYPELFRKGQRAYLQYFTRQTVRHAAAIVAVSENTCADIVRILGVSLSRVHVIPNGLDESMKPLPKEQVRAWRRSRGLPDRFVLFVGTLEPRKNLPLLLSAYARLPQSTPPLVIAGGKGWYYGAIDATVERLGLGERVIFPGFVPQEELAWWYNAAEVFVYPSLYEGFGWPPLEAMACGTPVIVSRSSSLPEVVGDAGMLVSPDDVQGLSEKIAELLAEPEERQAWRDKGLARAAAFSWRSTAHQTAMLYHQVLGIERNEPSCSA
jgi:glycosyltransferase involved in cell wall biosynthesis